MAELGKQAEASLMAGLAKIVPGFSGYLDRESRRRDDRAARDFLASRLQECKRDLQSYVRPLAEQGKLTEVLAAERLREQIELIQNRTAAAFEGYASWFDARNIDADRLKQVADLDIDLVSVVDRLHQSITGDDKNPPNLAQCNEWINLYRERFAKRGKLLSE